MPHPKRMTCEPEATGLIIPLGNRIGGGEAWKMARRRYQNPRPKLRGDRWTIIVRQEVELPDGTVARRQRRIFLGTRSDLATEKLALRAAKPILDKLNSAVCQPAAAITFADFTARWQRSVLAEMKPSTQQDYRSILRIHLLPAFGDFRLHAISPEMVQTFIAWKRRDLSPGRVWNIVTVMRSAWKTALAWGVVSENPFKYVLLRSPAHAEGRCFTVEEVRRILAAAEEPFRTLYWLAAETGMRAGELLALRGCDIDEIPGTVFVRRAFSADQLGKPKSARGMRAFPISQQLSASLAALKAFRADSEALLFTDGDAKPWTQWRLLKRHLQPLLKRLGITRAGMHAFRHASAKVGAELASPRVMQERLGHSDEKVTLRYYGHAFSQDHRKAADRIGEQFAPQPVAPGRVM